METYLSKCSLNFSVCVGLVFASKYVQFCIIYCLLQSIIIINTVEVDLHSDSLQNEIVKVQIPRIDKNIIAHLNSNKSIFLAIMVTYEIYKINLNQCGESFTVIFGVYSAGLKYIKLLTMSLPNIWL